MVDTTTLTIGDMIREARARRGLSTYEVAHLAGTQQQNVTAAENRNKVWPALLDRLIPVLELDRDAAYHASGRVPAEIMTGLAADLPLMREVRERLGL